MSTLQPSSSVQVAVPCFLPSLSRTLQAQQSQETIYWEMLSVAKHIDLLHEWVGLPYAQPFWQMHHLSIEQLSEHYQQVLACGHATSLIGYYKDQPVCQVAVYAACADETSRYYAAEPSDIGIHFLMAPVQDTPVPALSVTMMRSVLRLLFTLPGVVRIIGEPDSRNTKANILVLKAGFRFLYPISMSYKEANLYCCTPESFNLVS